MAKTSAIIKTMDGFLIIYLTVGFVIIGLFLATKYHEKHSK